MEIAGFFGFVLFAGMLVTFGVLTAGVWAMYWAHVRGFNQIISGLQSLDAKLAELAKR